MGREGLRKRKWENNEGLRTRKNWERGKVRNSGGEKRKMGNRKEEEEKEMARSRDPRRWTEAAGDLLISRQLHLAIW